MQLNVTTDYAIRIILYLALRKEITTSKEIAAAMSIPQNYVLKITHKQGLSKGLLAFREASRLIKLSTR